MAPGRSQKFYYNPAGVAFNAGVIGKIDGFNSSAHSQAASRAVLRHGRHNDGSENATRACILGLHPMFFGLNNLAGLVPDNPRARKELLHETLADAMDTLASLDRLDGGITLMVRCPGYCVESGFKAVEDITVDAYISPHEVYVGRSGIQEHVALLVQKFATDVVVPHLHRFTERCMEEGVPDVQHPTHGKKFSAQGPNHLPPFEGPGSGHVRCHCFPAATLSRDIAAYKLPLTSKRNKVPRAVKREAEDNDGVVYMGTTIAQTDTASLTSSGWPSASSAASLSE
ncbi:hypothetical protein F5887DRAFT_1075057 [Amanita rubescens]|nr:hypothetical protein F5887DRAFT_1075057 [Amanita rubescens]